MGRPLRNDLTGQRFGRLEVTGRAPNQNGKVMWYCDCDCGGSTIVESSNLIFTQMSCGCYKKERMSQIHAMNPPIGSRFGRLVVISHEGAYCKVRCDCGTEKLVRNKHLRDGSTSTCGCRGNI